VSQNTDRWPKEERNESERINVEDARMEEKRRGWSDDKIERAEQIPSHLKACG